MKVNLIAATLTSMLAMAGALFIFMASVYPGVAAFGFAGVIFSGLWVLLFLWIREKL